MSNKTLFSLWFTPCVIGLHFKCKICEDLSCFVPVNSNVNSMIQILLKFLHLLLFPLFCCEFACCIGLLMGSEHTRWTSSHYAHNASKQTNGIFERNTVFSPNMSHFFNHLKCKASYIMQLTSSNQNTHTSIWIHAEWEYVKRGT